jgi:hypothetical protein
MIYDDFRKSILKVKNKRKHKIKNSIGVRDIYKLCQKNKWVNVGKSVSESEFYKIIRTIKNLIA